ncbi:Acyl-CoA synthetase family member 4 [Stylophora pistillata]|uniref:Acyl-CoA synthetase family member 4 n=1 Tax=Stylophora pistillata TaxID=50429 RepID=A0A2B4RXM3_STYPI|nr:Acyl-CoA synthetase family member 4 [Stylophora pistillata]
MESLWALPMVRCWPTSSCARLRKTSNNTVNCRGITAIGKPCPSPDVPSETVRVVLPFKDQSSVANYVKQQLNNLSSKLNVNVQPVFVSPKLEQELKRHEIKPPIVNLQCLVYEFKRNLCDVGLRDGKVLWESRLGDRIESSAALSLCGRYVVVGICCYDGQVYVLNRFTSETSWTFQPGNKLWEFETQASVFCSPTLYQSEKHDSRFSNCIVFGSHDKHVYCLSLNGELSWSFTTDGPVYSSPYVAMVNSNISCNATCNARHCDKCDTQLAVFALSIVGTLYILDFYSGVLLALHSLPGEIFSSPVVVDNQILIGCRDDYLYSLEILNGTEK